MEGLGLDRALVILFMAPAAGRSIVIVMIVWVAFVVDGVGELGIALSTLHAEGAEGGLVLRLLVLPKEGPVVTAGS